MTVGWLSLRATKICDKWPLWGTKFSGRSIQFIGVIPSKFKSWPKFSIQYPQIGFLTTTQNPTRWSFMESQIDMSTCIINSYFFFCHGSRCYLLPLWFWELWPDHISLALKFLALQITKHLLLISPWNDQSTSSFYKQSLAVHINYLTVIVYFHAKWYLVCVLCGWVVISFGWDIVSCGQSWQDNRSAILKSQS